MSPWANPEDPIEYLRRGLHEAYEIFEGPISDEEYELLVYWRRSDFNPPIGTEEHDRFVVLSNRFLTQIALSNEALKAEAWHEAGHAIVAHVLGLQIRQIFRTEEGHPRTVTWPFPDPRRWALIRVAGYLSERQAMGWADPEEATLLVRVINSKLGYQPDQQLAYLEQIEQEASAILAANEDSVRRLAEMLTENIGRDGQEIRSAILGDPRN